MNYYTSMRCCHLGSADFNLLLRLFLKEQTTRRRSCVVPKEISATKSPFKELY